MNKWQHILKEQAAAHGQEHVGKELGVSKTVVSQLINDKYPGDLKRMQKLVEGAYMNRMVHCPILGDIALHQCDKHQGNTSTSNPIRLRLYRACRSGCDHSVLPIKKQFKRIAMTVNTDATAAKRYSADAVYSRLERQSVTDGGGLRQLCELLKQELKAMELRYNRLLTQGQPSAASSNLTRSENEK
ncbi:transcriptional regulator [Shewanella sp. GutCb]|uniref:helix-turn-helix domain-containing protein n=1 Tax=Shewanella sp. GutCb TaxID=2058315 RepID=UPI000C7CFFC8|nr:helix-turn-helix transcriptional regulator [Shewanella sp. GutCb]PKG74212.1 transcriptional regulator [Shewanella sp. GutCb]